ncbi:hypothetical protein OG937_37330 [Streptomyces sp. NBC_00510]|nr:hypothetical protein [Streptomyces sp. PA03-6a]
MIDQTALRRWGRAIDWAGLIPSGLLLFTGVREYRDGGSIGWPVAGALLVLASCWTVYRGMSRRRGEAGRPMP